MPVTESTSQSLPEPTVNTVLGPVRADELGIVALHETLLSAVPGAQYAFDIVWDRAEIFAALKAKLAHFRDLGGGTIVDASGMFHGRDLALYEALSTATGVHIVASTGMGPEDSLGGYFLTPQTNPPTPWPADRFADLFIKEVSDGMVVPRFERRAPAGLVTVAADPSGPTATEESLFRAAARTALRTGVAASIRFGADPITDLQLLLDEGLPAERVVIGGLDRISSCAVAGQLAEHLADRGACVCFSHVGTQTESFPTDPARASLIADLIGQGHAERLLISCNSTGVAMGHPRSAVDVGYLLKSFVPMLRAAGLGDPEIHQILVTNPARLLAVATSVEA